MRASSPAPLLGTLLAAALLLACAAALVLAGPARADDAAPVGDAKRVCAYSAHDISKLHAFNAIVGRDIDCAVVFANGQPDWSFWERPWYVNHGDPNYNWARWATQPGTQRSLVLTHNLIPKSAETEDWRHLGAAGAYDEHARQLARNLVAAGLGSSVMRLSHEANGDWYADSIGTTPEDMALWARFWRRTVLAMKSVPGANFRFDWCVNGRYRAIDPNLFYPGDDVVDIVGIDAYDGGVPAGQPRWATIYEKPLGIRDIERFAAAHGKPMSLPEWGVAPASSSLAGGDDPEYVDGIARVVRSNDVAYQAYFYNHEWAQQLAPGTQSLAAYIRHFGPGGDSVGPATSVPPEPAPSAPAPAPAPAPAAAQSQPAFPAPPGAALGAPVAAPAPAATALAAAPRRAGAAAPRITAGPRPGAVVRRTSATFRFAAPTSATMRCRLDRGAWRRCSDTRRDVLRRLRRGRHRWQVGATIGGGAPIVAARVFRRR